MTLATINAGYTELYKYGRAGKGRQLLSEHGSGKGKHNSPEQHMHPYSSDLRISRVARLAIPLRTAGVQDPSSMLWGSAAPQCTLPRLTHSPPILGVAPAPQRPRL